MLFLERLGSNGIERPNWGLVCLNMKCELQNGNDEYEFSKPVDHAFPKSTFLRLDVVSIGSLLA